MAKIVMYVYGNIQTDARVKRAAKALAGKYELILLSSDCGKQVKDDGYRNVLLKCKSSGLMGYFQSVREALKVVRREKPDVFYAHDYYSALIARLLLKRKHCKKIVYDAHELIIPEEGLSDARMKFFYSMEKAIVNKVDLLVCASQERAALMKEHYHLSKSPLVVENISYLPLGFDLSKLDAAKQLDNFFADKTPTLVYAGVVTKSRKIGSLFDMAAKLAPAVKLLIVGNGDALNEMKEKAAGQNTLKCCFTGAVPYEALGEILKRCDVGYLYYPTNTLNNINCASNKIYEYASVGLPIVANNNPTVKRILEHGGIGISSDDFEDALKQTLSNLNDYKKACAKFVDDNRWEKTALRLLEDVEKM